MRVSLRSSVTKAVVCLATIAFVFLPATLAAITLPISEDSFASAGTVRTKAGSATRLDVASDRVALLHFELPEDISADQVQNARLRIYISSVTQPGELRVRTVTSSWSEDLDRALVLPSIAPEIVTGSKSLPVAKAKRFISFDVTSAVQDWLSGALPNHGLAIDTLDGKLRIAAKEGYGTGHPAELEIETNPVLPFLFNFDSETRQILGGSIAPGTIGSVQLGLNSVTTSSIADGSITGAKIPLEALTGAHLQTGTVPMAKLAFESAVFADRKPPNTAGGTSVENAWQRRMLNWGQNQSTGSISREGNTITLQPGTYFVRASCPAYQAGTHQAALRDVTNGENSTALLGTSERLLANISPAHVGRSFVEGFVEVVDAPRRYELWHFTRQSVGTYGLGLHTQFDTPPPFGNSEDSVYSVISIIRIK